VKSALAVKVLIVDDSALVRQVLERGLSADPMIHVIATAADPYAARDRIVEQRPDVITLDVEMPRMDGVEFLRKLMPQMPIPVVMVSSLTQAGAQATLDALEAGAVDFVAKPGNQFGVGLENMLVELREKVKAARRARVTVAKPRAPLGHAPADRTLKDTTDKVIAIGASTGGTEALREVLSQFPADMPGTVVVQHMPAKFTEMYAERLNRVCAMEVREAKDGDRVMPGRILLAPGGLQMNIVRRGGQYRVECRGTDRVSGHCPSVDHLFHSVARDVGSNAAGVILTGMGADGADGLLKMREAGAATFGQDEATCVVYGMPKVAYERGAVQAQYPLEAIAPAVLNLMRRGFR
jgi:two-component system, chemotaxis family, protein-glutamate methylesterase/glutaminase